MALSARNHLTGTIEEITHDAILCHVVVRAGDSLIESVITGRRAVPNTKAFGPRAGTWRSVQKLGTAGGRASRAKPVG